MDTKARTQIRLILDQADDHARSAYSLSLAAIYAENGAKGRLQSGETVKSALRAMEELATKFVTGAVDGVAPVGKDIEAFAMISEAVEGLLRHLELEVDRVASKAAGNRARNGGHDSIFNGADLLFGAVQQRILRQLEIHRFAFTVPEKIRFTPLSTMAQPAKNPGGKPMAAHWDEMWASLAVALYTGDLQPKTQADIERAIKDWFAERDRDVGDTPVRDRARQLWQKLKAAE